MQSLLFCLTICALSGGSLACFSRDETTQPDEPTLISVSQPEEAAAETDPPKRSMPGGKTAMTPEEIAHPDFQAIVQKSLDHLETQSKGCKQYELVDVSEAEKQVVQGMKYSWKMKVRPHSSQPEGVECPLGEEREDADAEENTHHEYQSTAWVRPWLKDEPTHQFTHKRTDD